MRNSTLSRLLPVMLLALLPLLLFWRWLVYGQVLYWGTIMLQFWPWHQPVKDSLLQGQWPLWNPLLGNGAPLLANLQSAVFYPPNLIFLFMPTAHALTLSIILHIALAGIAMYFYGRRLRLSGFAAAVAALTYMFSGYIMGRTQFVVMIHAAAWIPLLLLLGDRLARQRHFLDVLWLAVALAGQLLAGHAQLWFYSLVLLGGYVGFRSWQADRLAPLLHRSDSHRLQIHDKVSSPFYASRLTGVVKAVGYLLIAVLLSLLLCAVQIGPTAEYLLNSPRNDGAERTFALTYSMWPWRLITLVAPNFFGHPAQGNYWGYANYWEDHAYLGILPFILALTAITISLKTAWQNRHATSKKSEASASTRVAIDPLSVAPFFAVMIPISLVLAMGWNTPIYLWVFTWVPGFRFFQAPARLLIWYTVAMAILAGVGAQYFQSTAHNRPHWRRFLAACIALTLAGLIGQWWLAGREITFLTATRNLGLWLIGAVVILLLRPQKREQRLLTESWWQGIAILFVSIDLLLAAWPLIPLTSASVFSTPIASAQRLKEQPYRYFVDEQFAYRARFNHYFRFKSFGPTDAASLQMYKESLVPNFGVYAHLPSANNDDPLVVGKWQTLLNLIEKSQPERQARLLALMNVGAVVNDAPDHPWPVITETEMAVIRAVPNPLPRAYFVAQAVYVDNEREAIDQIIESEFDPRQEVVIIKLEDVALPDHRNAPAEFVPVDLIAETTDVIQLRVDAPTDGFVILTDTFYPGWQATVDDQSSTVWPANVAFRAVAVEAGSHTLNFFYRPQPFTFGLWTTTVVCSIIGVAMIRLTRQQKNQTVDLNLKTINDRKNL
ncbi:MAG: hypothetical protein KDJ52_12380 [Anaerolineae bacterium]|nr:hypothetical protein [Anaerolineae bacterium]